MNWLKELLTKNKETKNVTYLGGVDWPVNRIMEHAVRSKLESVTVIGWTKNGELYINSTHAKRGDLHWDLSLAARNVLDK